MLKRPVTQDDFARLEDERLAADRRYNEALTAVDRAMPAPVPQPASPGSYDEQEIPPLNELWRVRPAQPPPSGVRGRLASLVWRIVAPWLAKQETFNARVVAHINNNVRHHRELVTSVTAAAPASSSLRQITGSSLV